MNEMMKLILSLSISGSILIGLLLLIKPFIKHKLSKSLQYYIWIVVLLRLVLPFSFEESILNDLFNRNHFFAYMSSQGQDATNSNVELGHSNPILSPNTEANQTSEKLKGDADHSLIRMFEQSILYIWLIGVILSLTIKLKGYTRFTKYMRKTSKPAFEWERRMFGLLLNGRRNKVKVVRNPYVATPMLIGILKPTIIIPDTNFNEIQLKNILLHEITHLKRFDIVLKWFSMIATSLHWFNPLLYFLEKEINHLCELSCDEMVISKFSSSEKQQYGETLITVASNERYPVGLQATFSDEKTILKERLMAIMRPSRKSKFIVLLSVVLVAVVVFSAMALGANVGGSTSKIMSSKSPIEPPSILILHERNPDPIDNYKILKWSWDGTKYDQQGFYQTAWNSEPTLLTGLRRLKPEEKISVDFGTNTPDKVTVKMAYLTESYDESLLPIVEVPFKSVDGKIEFINPPGAISDIQTTGRVYSITAVWGQNSCEYVFASDGKFDQEEPGQ